MNLWQFFTNKEEQNNPNFNTIYQEVQKSFPDYDDDQLARIVAISSMMSRVAYADLDICKKEQVKMSESVHKWFEFSKDESQKLIELVVKYTKVLSGIENHLYARELNQSLSKPEKIKLLNTLFAIAASDDSVTTIEENEIYNITTELLLTKKEYVQAKMTVLDFLAALKK